MHYVHPASLLAPSPPLPALALFLGVALLLVAAVRWWRHDLAWSDGLLYLRTPRLRRQCTAIERA
jgi:hypothetical protein